MPAIRMASKNNTDKHWDIVIEPQSHVLHLRLKEVWHYRDLLLLLVKRDFISFYKQTILGPLWFFIQPLFTTIIYTFVFNRLAGIKTDGLPAPLFYMAGITAWNYFSDCLLKTSTVFKDNASVFGKVYFPRLIMPLSIVISNLVRFGVQLLLFFGVMFFYHLKGASFHISSYVLLFPVIILQLAMLGLGAGMIISALTTKYRDLAFLVSFGVQLLMYATTVIYPLSAAPEKYKWLIQANPLTSVIETFRLGFLGQGEFSWQAFSNSMLITLAIAFAGVIIFNRVERDFIDTV
jgi:lipopolysaccharide transport system permease protein